jgi:formate C-acetyltransferase
MSTKPEPGTQQPDAWRNFSGESWKRDIDVRDFISSNVTPYSGDEAFLVGPTARNQDSVGKAPALLQ